MLAPSLGEALGANIQSSKTCKGPSDSDSRNQLCTQQHRTDPSSYTRARSCCCRWRLGDSYHSTVHILTPTRSTARGEGAPLSFPDTLGWGARSPCPTTGSPLCEQKVFCAALLPAAWLVHAEHCFLGKDTHLSFLALSLGLLIKFSKCLFLSSKLKEETVEFYNESRLCTSTCKIHSGME